MIKGSFIIFTARYAEFSGHAALERCIFFSGKKIILIMIEEERVYCVLKRRDETTGPPSKFNSRENVQLAARDLISKKVADTVIPGKCRIPR